MVALTAEIVIKNKDNHPQTTDSRSSFKLVGIPPTHEALIEEPMFADELIF